MIVCPNCKHVNMAGAIICSECGNALPGSNPLTTQNIDTSQIHETVQERPDQTAPAAAPPMPVVLNNWVTLHLLDTGQMLQLAERNEFTLGRISEGQPIMPDIDLSPYQAYANGVSRLHAVIKRGPDGIALMDLGSANGTFLNGKRMNPNVERDLSNGDVVALGRLKIQILLNQS